MRSPISRNAATAWACACRRRPEAVGLRAGADVDILVENGDLLLRKPARTWRQLLEVMVAEMKRLGGRDAEPELVDWGPDRGEEILPTPTLAEKSRSTISCAEKPSKTAKWQKAGHHAASRRRRHRLG
jgi:hypothetical protein